jgi:hypothetical protein
MEGHSKGASVFYALAVVALCVFIREMLQVLEAIDRSNARARDVEATELVAACKVLQEQLCKRFQSDIEQLAADQRPDAFRVCVYRVMASASTGQPAVLERATGYAVARRGRRGRIGDRISAAVGIVGLAYRTGQSQVARRESTDLEAFYTEMIQEWGFDEADVRSLNASRWSYLACPIQGDDGRVGMVLFIDSGLPNCFNDEVVEDFVGPTCAAITSIAGSVSRA